MITVTAVHKRFGATAALVDVSAEFRAGEVHCVLGENGAGKSTLGKVICGLHRADQGVIKVDGRETGIAGPKGAHALGIAIVHQELSLAPHLSVRANLWLGSEGARQPFALTRASRERGRAEEVLDMLSVHVDLEQPVGQLPVAQQQLIEIGKALMHKPRAIIFDEPTAMLGAVEKQKFLAVLRKLRDDGVAAVLVTHHIEDVMAVSDRVTIMRNGRVVDSFTMTPTISEDEVVERLTGKKRRRAQADTQHKGVGDTVLEIAELPVRGGAPVTLEIKQGQVVAFYGVVGCGAEDIVAALAGQRATSLCRFRLRGREYRPSSGAAAMQRGVAYLPAGRAAHGVLPARSILENLTVSHLRRHARFGCLSLSEESAYVKETLARAAVKYSDARLPITSLSGGNQQKVLLARAMAAASELLVLEEPTAGVDIDAKAQIHARIRAAADAGLTVVLLSSDLEETLGLADVVHTMYCSALARTYNHPDAGDQPSIIADVLGQSDASASQQSVAEAFPV